MAKAQQLEIVQASPASTPTLISMIGAIVSRPDVDVGKLRELLTMQREVEAEAARCAFNGALNGAQTEMAPIVKDAKNDHTKSKYASFKALDDAVRPIYTKHGFSLSYNTGDNAPPGHIMVLATLSRGAHEREYKAPIPVTTEGFKGTAMMTQTHATGSAFTYGQRYLLKMIFNIAVADKGTDDDGNAAGGATTKAADANEPITQPQEIELKAVAAGVGADETRFCKYVGAQWGRDVASFADITRGEFEAAKTKLLSKKKAP